MSDHAFKLAICQIRTELNKQATMDKAEAMVKQAAVNGATVVVLPAMYNCPYSKEYFSSFADAENGESVEQMSAWARENGIILIGKEPLEAFTEAMNNIMPSLEVKARRVGGATYQVPIEVRPARRQTLGLRWLVGYARKRGEKTMKERLAGEIMDACNNLGASVKKREDTHKMADSNKAFAHFRW